MSLNTFTKKQSKAVRFAQSGSVPEDHLARMVGWCLPDKIDRLLRSRVAVGDRTTFGHRLHALCRKEVTDRTMCGRV